MYRGGQLHMLYTPSNICMYRGGQLHMLYTPSNICMYMYVLETESDRF